MTVGISVMRSPPWFKADAWASSGWRVGHGQVRAEVGDAAERVHGQAGRGEPELHGWVVWPAALVAVGAESAREVGVHVRRPHAKRMGHREKAVGRDLLATAFDLREVGRRESGFRRDLGQGAANAVARRSRPT